VRRRAVIDRNRRAALALLLLAGAGAAGMTGCRGKGGAPAGAPAGAGPGSILKDTDQVLMQRVLPAALGDGAMALVVKNAEGAVELRLAERRKDGALAVTFTSRPADEFRNLSVEDVTGDGTPEVTSTWLGGQLEVIEVLGRDAQGAWRPLLQNGGQTIETRRHDGRAAAFWITSRTYEEEAGQPPVYQTTIFDWNGQAFAAPADAAARH
jgi:hypothetical protein